jgi:hypothetical protein
MDLADWCVIGNANADFAAQHEAKLLIGFNATPSKQPIDVTICNQASKGRYKTITVIGPKDARRLQKYFQAQARLLEPQLGSWPSLGLVVVYSGISAGLQLQVRNMNLLPTLTRPNGWLQRQVVPSHFHNWLGERRLIAKWLHCLDWPEFTLPSPSTADFGDIPHECPLRQLCELPRLAKPSASAVIDQLAAVDNYDWHCALTQTTTEELLLLDHLFVLDRHQHHTANWWLFDPHYSACMDIIRYRLAQAQQSLFAP